MVLSPFTADKLTTFPQTPFPYDPVVEIVLGLILINLVVTLDPSKKAALSLAAWYI